MGCEADLDEADYEVLAPEEGFEFAREALAEDCADDPEVLSVDCEDDLEAP